MSRVAPIDVARRLHGREAAASSGAAGPGSAAGRGWLHGVVVGADIEQVHRAGLRWWLAGGFTLAMMGRVLVGPAFALGVCVAVLLGPIVMLVRWSGRRHRRVVAELPLWLEMIDRSLRSGSSFRQALRESHEGIEGPLRQELTPVLSSLAGGSPLSAVLGQLVDSVPGTEIRLVAASLSLAAENEAGVGRALAGVSQALRDRAALRDEVVGTTAQAAASMHALVLLPVAFLGFDGLVGGSTLTFLVAQPLGRLCLVVGCTLNIAGWVWMRLTIRRRLPK